MCIGQLGRCSFLYYYFISFHMNSSHILKQNSSKQIIPKEITRPNLRTHIRSKAKHKRPAQKYYVNETSNNDKQNENSNFFLFLFSHFVWCCCSFFALAFTLFLFKTYNLIWLFSSIFWLVGSVCCGNRASKRHI